jgi:hypothetical protein
MKTQNNIGLRIFLTLLISIFGGIAVSYADTILMANKTFMTGKIIKDTPEGYEFANARGTFLVKKKFIVKIYKTNSFEEDIQIQKKTKKNVNENAIEKNYIAGVKVKESKDQNNTNDENVIADEKEIKNKKLLQWYYGRIVITGSYFSTFISDFAKQYKNIDQVLPSGFAAELAYEQGFEKKKAKKNNMAIPALRIAFGYINFSNEIKNEPKFEISGYTAQAGLMWALPSLLNQKGCFTIGAMSGLSFIDIVNRSGIEDKKAWCFTPAVTAFLGYEYYFKVVSLVVQIRYSFLYDVGVAFHGLAGTVGVAFKLW